MKKNLKNSFSVIIILMFLVSFGWAAVKKEPGINSKDFAAFVAKTLADWKVPGVGVAVVKNGKVILAEGYGFRDVQKKLPVTPHTIFAIGSATKAFTATAVGVLVDEGKINWDKPVIDYLPNFRLYDPIATVQVTTRDLLCHRTGVPRYDFAWLGSSASRKELFERIKFLEPNTGLRSLFQYNNFMYMAAGYLVEHISGSSWEEFVQRRIFDPLGMKESNFSVEISKKKSDLALPYGLEKDKLVEFQFRNIDAMGPAGSINSSALDMAQWVLFNLNKGQVGDKKIISGETLAEIHSAQMVIKQGEFRLLENFPEMSPSNYGLGWIVTTYRGHIWIHHGGNVDGFTSLVTFFPRDNFGIVVLSNMNGTFVPEIIALNIADRLLGLDQVDWNKRLKDIFNKLQTEEDKAKKEEEKDRKMGTKPSHPLEEYVGEYENPAFGSVVVSKEGEGLRLKTPALEGPLTHYHYDVFELRALLMGSEMKRKVSFESNIKGDIHSLSIQLEPAVKDIVFIKKSQKKTEK
jgi:CubicO group peptidase (beta-lactamase class C family)